MFGTINNQKDAAKEAASEDHAQVCCLVTSKFVCRVFALRFNVLTDSKRCFCFGEGFSFRLLVCQQRNEILLKINTHSGDDDGHA